MSNQGNQDSTGNQNNAIQGQRTDRKNRQTQQRTLSNQDNTHKATQKIVIQIPVKTGSMTKVHR